MTSSRLFARIFTVLWGAAVVTGFSMMMSFDFTPGDSGDPPAVWPAGSAIKRQAGRSDLLMILHPHCPCSRSSLAELEKIAARTVGLVSLHVILVSPVGAAAGWAGWAGDDAKMRAESIPGVTLFDDLDGVEASRFRITTSGHTLLYDAAGLLRFSGGITPARGHEGDNAGSQAILSFVEDATTTQPTTPVFGCSVVEPPICRR